jgi:hypothetical protein
MAEQIEVSPQAMGIATLEIIYRILDRLVEHQLMTEDDVTALFAKAAEEQKLVDRPANQEAAELLAWIATERGGK